MRETSIEVSGKTVDEATQNALAQLGLDRDEVRVEILERAKTGFLGIGSTLARVKVTYETDEPLPEPEPVAVKEAAPVKTAAPTAPKAPPTPASPAAPSGLEGPAARADQFLAGLLERMDLPAAVDIRQDEGILRIELKGDNMGTIIGRRGEMLDAIQHLTSYVVNRGASKRTRIHIDAENYRKKREETLIRLARKMADKVIRYRKNMGLEPMNSYERHVIHAALQDMDGVTTYSAGVEPNRRVFVAYDKEQPAAPRQQTHREWS